MTMRFRHGSRAGLVALCLAAAVPAVAAPSAEALDRPAAAKAAVAALDVRDDARAVRVYGLRETVAAGTRIAESGPATTAVAATKRDRRLRRAGVELLSARGVMRVGDEAAWLFYEDRGPNQAYEHAGRVALVGATTGRVRVSRALRWAPLVDGALPAFFRSSAAYRGSRYRVFDRPFPASAVKSATPSARGAQALDRATLKLAADALAAERSCALRISDTLGDFYDFGGVDRTRARLGLFLAQLAEQNRGFVTARYSTRAGQTPTQTAQRLIDGRGCKDLLVYVAGGASRSGAPAIVIGVRPRAGAKLEWHTLTAADLQRLVRANPGVTFKFVLDAPYTSRIADVLRAERNVLVLLTSGTTDEPSFTYLPEIVGGSGVLRNTGNPDRLLEFTNGLLNGLERFAGDRAEVAHALVQTGAGRARSFMAWMLARAAGFGVSPFAAQLTAPSQLVPATTGPQGPPKAPVPASGTPTPQDSPVGGSSVANRAPQPTTPSQTTDEDTPRDITLTATDSDGDGLSFAIAAQPLHGTLSGTAPDVRYAPERDFNGTDSFSYRVTDDRGAEATATVSITVTPDNDRPAVVGGPDTAQPSYTEDGAPVVVDGQLTVTDPDSNELEGATAEIAEGRVAGDALAADVAGTPITAQFADGVLTLTGRATLADYQKVLRSVRFGSTSQEPGASRIVRFVADDGDELGDPASRDIAVVSVDDAPVITRPAGTQTTTEDTPLTFTAGTPSEVSVADVDAGTEDLRVTASVNDGTLSVGTTMVGLAVTGNGTATLTLTGTLAELGDALDGLVYAPADDHTGTDSLMITADDLGHTGAGTPASLTDSETIALSRTAVNDAPVLTQPDGGLAYAENAAATAIAPNLTASDVDSAEGASATVKITAGYVAGQDVLSYTGPLTATVDGDTLTLTGAATIAEYQTALRAVRFANTSDDPTAGARTVAFTLTDSAGAVSAAVTRSIDVSATNDAPTVDASNGSAGFTEGDAGGVVVDPALAVADPDDANLEGATIQVTTNRDAATDELLFDPRDGITQASFTAATGTLILQGTASVAAYQAALRSIRFRATGDDPSDATRTIAFRVTDGTAESAVDTREVLVSPVNDLPVVTTSPGSAAWTEGAAPTAVDPGLTVADPDDASLQSARVAIADGRKADDRLTFPDDPNLIESYDSSTGVLTVTGAAPKATYQAFLRQVRFSNSGAAPTADPRSVTFTVNDGDADSVIATRTVEVTEVNTAATVTASSGTAAFTEDGAPVTIDGGVAVSDPDSSTLANATVRLTTNYAQGSDTLGYTTVNGISGTFDAATGTLTLTGSAKTPAQYQAALRSVTFGTTAQNPATSRAIEFRVDDGSSVNGTSNAATRGITITPVNDRPVVVTSGGSASFTEGGAASTVDPFVSVTDVDSETLSSATVKVNDLQSGDTLDATVTGTGLTKSFNPATGVLTLGGLASKATYQSVLRTVTFDTDSTSPGTSRTIGFQVEDAAPDNRLSDLATRTVTITNVNSAPVVTTSNGTTSYTEDGGASTVDPSVDVTDADSATLTGGTVQIRGGRIAGDQLDFANQSGITGSYDASSGLLTLSGSATVASYRAALRSVRFRSTSDDPAGTRTIVFRVTDGEPQNAPSNEATKSVSVTGRNDRPVITVADSTPATYTEGNPPVGVNASGAVSVSDVDSPQIVGATVRFSGTYRPEDVLAATGSGGVGVAFDTATGQLTLSGAASPSVYEDVLESVTYRDTSTNPSTAQRTLEFVVDDGGSENRFSTTATRQLRVVAVNNAPVLTQPDGTLTYTEGDPATPIAPSLTASDIDSANLTGATVRFASGYQGTQDVLSVPGPLAGGITFSYAGGTATLSGTATVAQYQDALRSIRYQNTSGTPSTVARSVEFQVDDGGSQNRLSTVVTRAITVVARNSAPVARDDAFSGSSRAVGNTALVVDDPTDGAPDPAGPQKTITGDILANDEDEDSPTSAFAVTPIADGATADGGRYTLEADGDFTFFPKVETSCTDHSDTFDYTLSDGDASDPRTDTGTVTITIADCVWYIDQSASRSTLDGSSARPFPVLSLINRAGGNGDSDRPGEKLFVYAGTYDGGLPMEAQQKLYSKRHGLAVDNGDGDGDLEDLTLEAPAPNGARTAITGGMQLALDDEVQGIDLGAFSGVALRGTDTGSTIFDSETSGQIDNPNGGAVNLQGTTSPPVLDVALSSISANGGTFTDSGIRIVNATGTFTGRGGTLANASDLPGNADVDLEGGALNFTYDGSIADDTGRLVEVTGATGGTKDFNGPIGDGNDGDGTGIRLNGNTGATIRLDGALTLATAGDTALAATGGGTVVATGATNQLNSTNAATLNVRDTTIGSDGLRFQKVSSSGGSGSGIVLSNTGTAGGTTITGSGGTCTPASTTGCTGGTIANKSGGGDSSSPTPPDTGIVLNETRNVSLTRMYVHDHANYAIRGTSVNGFALSNSVINGANGTTPATPNFDSSIYLQNLSGTAPITDTAISGGRSDNVHVTNTSGTLNRLTLTRATLGATSGTASNGGNSSLLVESQGSANTNVTIDNSTLTGAPAGLIRHAVTSSGSNDLVLTNNALSNGQSQATGATGMLVTNDGTGSLSTTITGNTLRDSRSTAILVEKGEPAGTLTGSISGNAIGVSGVANSGSVDGSGIAIEQGGDGTMSLSANTNTIRQVNGYGMLIQAGLGTNHAGALNVKASGNTLAEPGSNAAIPNLFQGILVNSGTQSGDSFQTCVELGANAITGAGRNGGDDLRVRQRMNTTVKLPGYGGGNRDNAAVVSYLRGRVGGSPLTSASNETTSTPNGGGFVGGSSCF